VAGSAGQALAAAAAPNPDDAVALVAAVSASAGCAWLALTATLTLLTLDWRRSGYRHDRFAVAVHALSPRVVHHFAAVALSVGIVAGPAQSAMAAGPFDPSWAAPVTPGPGAPVSPGRSVAATATGGTTDVVVVRPGDSLWTIAAARLPAGSGLEDVARAWPLWFGANRSVIGDDPDLIVPGQHLTPPISQPRSPR